MWRASSISSSVETAAGTDVVTRPIWFCLMCAPLIGSAVRCVAASLQGQPEEAFDAVSWDLLLPW